MARQAGERKAETRRHIITTAGERFKQDGIDGSGIATLMADAGLTNGAFYAHFESKDDLVAHAIADQLSIQHASLASLPPGREALQEFARGYLSPSHRDHPGTGCPSAALLDEIGRCDGTVRDSYTEGIKSIIDAIAARFPSGDSSAARTTALGLITVLVATMQLARAVSDRTLSDDILAAGIINAQVLLGAQL